MLHFYSPCRCAVDDSTDVGEEDSFVGQTSGNGHAPSTFSYFSSPITSTDPFASIGHSPCPPPVLSAAPTTTGHVSVPSSVSMIPPQPPPASSQMNPSPSMFGSAVYQSPMGRHTPPPTTMTPPPPQMQPQSHNPYRHTPTSSRASPYIPAPEIMPPTHTPQQNPYLVSSPPQTFPPSGPMYTKVSVAPVLLIKGFINLFGKLNHIFLSSASSHADSGPSTSTSSHHSWSRRSCCSHDAVQLQRL